MRRRDFVTLFGSTALAWPFAGHTQQLNNHRIGYLGVASAASQDTRFGAFRAGLAALGYVEGKNIVIEQRWLGNRPYDQLDNLARQLVDWRHAATFVDKILKGTRSILATQQNSSPRWNRQSWGALRLLNLRDVPRGIENSAQPTFVDGHR